MLPLVSGSSSGEVGEMKVKLQRYIHTKTEWWAIINPETDQRFENNNFSDLCDFGTLENLKLYCNAKNYEIVEINWQDPNSDFPWDSE